MADAEAKEKQLQYYKSLAEKNTPTADTRPDRNSAEPHPPNLSFEAQPTAAFRPNRSGRRVDHHTTPRHRSLVITTVYPRLHMSSLQICLIGQHHETRSSIKLAHGRQKNWGHSASVQLDRSNSPPHEVLKAGKT